MSASDSTQSTAPRLRLEEALALVRPLDSEAMQAASEYQHSLLKPAGSLGELESIAIRFAGITGQLHNDISRKVHLLFGSDHGIYEEGVSGTPQHFTRRMMEFYANGVGCGINVLCAHVGVDLRLFDLGVKGLAPHPHIDASCRLMPEGTENFARKRAMTRETALRAVEFGLEAVGQAKRDGYQIAGTGEVGMGNTSAAAACIMAALRLDDPEMAVGRGGGLTDEALARKKQVISEALSMHAPNPDDALDILSCVGGLDIAAMTGVFLGAVVHRLPVVIDGVISVAGALLAAKLTPLVTGCIFASHHSREPGYSIAIEALGLTPMLTLGMRLGEGSGCPVAMQVIDSALAVMNRMDTFDEASLESDYRAELKQD
ncbi:MAG: nicotinate-nucleotide--dimethylbenzimidazole phosphoribosyltransferase [Fretibacterium sp.]|nr:nicotinate-nucleotide--dimethylbenzimidazole phosphoribosyltransferase [Fretibacterium sp.]